MSDKRAFWLVAGITIVVFAIIIVLKLGVVQPDMEPPSWMYNFPMYNAIINGTCSVLLITSFLSIRKKKVERHKRLNILTFALSALFILLYVSFHLFVPSTHFGGEGPMKSIYFIILISHIVLAALVLPGILIAFYFGLKMKIQTHRKVVRIVFPVWLYVTVTGVLVYLMISPYYEFP